MAEVISGILTLSDTEAGAIAGWLEYEADRQANPPLGHAMRLLAEQLMTMKERDPFDGRRFMIAVEQSRTRQ